MFEDIFKLKKAVPEKLTAYGFEKLGGDYIFRSGIMGGEYCLAVIIDKKGKVDTNLTDSAGEEYILYKTDAQGIYLASVREAVSAALADIAKNCFDDSVFKARQTLALISYAATKYEDEPEYLWPRFPENAVLRRKDNQKWYAAILTAKGKIFGLESDTKYEIVNLRAEKGTTGDIIAKNGYYPGYHMNKNSWYTVVLDGTVSDEELFARLDESYLLAPKK